MIPREEIKAIMFYMKSAYPNYNPVLDDKQNAIDVLLDLLGDLDSDTLWLAVKQSCSEPGRQFAPSVGEIRGAALNIKARASGFPDVSEVWGSIIRSFKQIDGHDDVLDHPIAQEAIGCMGGLYNLEMSENIATDRAHFFRFFEQIRDRELKRMAELPVVTEYIESQLPVPESKQLPKPIGTVVLETVPPPPEFEDAMARFKKKHFVGRPR